MMILMKKFTRIFFQDMNNMKHDSKIRVETIPTWFERFRNMIKKHNYSQGNDDHTLFKRNAKKVILLVYIDDMIVRCDDY